MSKEMDILKFEYTNLHASVWECHKVAWQSISIFIPILFALQGFFIEKFPEISLIQVILGACVTQSLVLIWRLMLHLLGRYNEKRTDRLIEIENSINNRYETVGVSVKQYHLTCGEDRKSKKKKEGCGKDNGGTWAKKEEKSRWEIMYDWIEKKISWGLIYNLIFVLITIMNVTSISLKALLGI